MAELDEDENVGPGQNLRNRLERMVPVCLDEHETSRAVVKKRTALLACTRALTTAIARWFLPRPVWPWKTKSWAASTKASDMRSSAP